jgi:hypothetical protein
VIAQQRAGRTGLRLLAGDAHLARLQPGAERGDGGRTVPTLTPRQPDAEVERTFEIDALHRIRALEILDLVGAEPVPLRT